MAEELVCIIRIDSTMDEELTPVSRLHTGYFPGEKKMHHHHHHLWTFEPTRDVGGHKSYEERLKRGLYKGAGAEIQILSPPPPGAPLLNPS